MSHTTKHPDTSNQTASKTAANASVEIITASWIIPMTQADHWLENHALVIEGSKILALTPIEQAKKNYPKAKLTELPGQVLMPGFVNSHCHAAMTLMRGLSDDLPLKQWLENAIWPAEAKFVDETFIYQGTQHAVAEMIRSGTTCVQDQYFIPEQISQVVIESGIRASVGLVIIDFETRWFKNAQDAIDKGMRVYQQFKDQPRLSFNLSPHAPYTVGKESLEKVLKLSNDHQLKIQIHVHETADEVDSFIQQHGVRPMTRLKEIGLLSPLLNAVHMTQLNEGEIDWLAESGSHVVHCPQSNMKLASGVCPTHQLLEAGVNLALGTDGAASNNDLDMIDETRSASLLAKLDYMQPTVLNAYQSLYLATMGGAKALGLENLIGSLEPGKAADFIAIDLNRIETQPVYSPISQIVYAASRDQVSHVWVDGRCLLKNRQLQSLNESQIITQVGQWQQKIAASIQPKPSQSFQSKSV